MVKTVLKKNKEIHTYSNQDCLVLYSRNVTQYCKTITLQLKEKKTWIQQGSRRDLSAAALVRGFAAVTLEADGSPLFRRARVTVKMYMPRLVCILAQTHCLVMDTLCQFLPSV